MVVQMAARLTRMMGISALSLAGMKKKARTMTRAAMTICANANSSCTAKQSRCSLTTMI